MEQQSEKSPRSPRSTSTGDETPIVASPESTGRSEEEEEAATPVFSTNRRTVADLESKGAYGSPGAVQAGPIDHRGEDAKREVMNEMRQALHQQPPQLQPQQQPQLQPQPQSQPQQTQTQNQPQSPRVSAEPDGGVAAPDPVREGEGEGGQNDIGLPFTTIRAHHGPPPPRNQNRDGPVNVDEVTLSTFGQSAYGPGGERSFTTRGEGDAESIYAHTVSTLGMTSVVTRQRRAWEAQQARFVNSLDCGDFQNENIRVDAAANNLPHPSAAASAHSAPSFPSQPTIEVVATVVDSVEEEKKRRKNPFKDWRVLVFILIAVSSIVGLVVALTTRPKPGESAKGANLENDTGGGAEESIFPVEMNPFSMSLKSSADMIDKNKLNNVTSGHLSKIMEKDIDSFKELDLAVVLTGRRMASESEWIGRALATSRTAFFRGSIKLIKDEKLHERFIRVLLHDAFSGNGLEMWLNAANAAGMGIISVTVFDEFGDEIGSLQDETATATPVASTVAPTFAPTVKPGSPTDAKPSEPTTATTAPISTSTPKPSPPPNPSPSSLPPTTPPVPEPTSSPTFGPTPSPTGPPVPGQTPRPTPTPTLGPTPRPTPLPTPLPPPIPTTPPTPLPTPKPVSTPTLAPVATTATTTTAASSRQNVIEITITMTLVISSEDEFNSDIFGSASLDHFFEILKDVDNFNKLALDFSLRWGRRGMRAVRRELSAEAELVLTYTVTFGGDGAVPSEVQAVANDAFSGSKLDGLVASFQDEGLGVESVTTYDEEGNEMSTSIPADSGAPSSREVLSTFLEAKFSREGAMFDVVSKGPAVTITSIDVHIATTGDNIPLEVWTKPGSYFGSERDRSVWSLSGAEPIIIPRGMGVGKLTPVPEDVFSPIVIPANGVVGFYVTLQAGGMQLGQGTETFSDNNLEMQLGVSAKYRFGATNPGRVWNGALKYVVNN